MSEQGNVKVTLNLSTFVELTYPTTLDSSSFIVCSSKNKNNQPPHLPPKKTNFLKTKERVVALPYLISGKVDTNKLFMSERKM